jgi:hypothetical protein
LKGELAADRRSSFAVGHPLIKASRYATPAETPGGLALSPKIFKPGGQLVVMASQIDAALGVWHETDMDVGTWPASDQNLSVIRKLIESR